MHVAHVRDTVRNKRDREEEEHRISERKSRVALSRFLDAERVINARYTVQNTVPIKPNIFMTPFSQAISIANTMLQFHHYSDSSVSFTSMLPPTIDSLNPAVGTFGGAHMTWLTGKNFASSLVHFLSCYLDLTNSLWFAVDKWWCIQVALLIWEYISICPFHIIINRHLWCSHGAKGNFWKENILFLIQKRTWASCSEPYVNLQYGSVDVTILSSSTSSGVRTEVINVDLQETSNIISKTSSGSHGVRIAGRFTLHTSRPCSCRITCTKTGNCEVYRLFLHHRLGC